MTERDELILANTDRVRAVACILRRKLPVSVELDDLCHAGIVGLIQAADSFDEARGLRFWSFAQSRVRGAMLDSLRALDYLPRNLRLRLKVLEGESSKNEECFRRYCRAVAALPRTPLSLSSQQGGRRAIDVADSGMRADAMIEQGERTRALDNAINRLQPRTRYIMTRRLQGDSLVTIGKSLSLNGSRICQISTEAIKTLRRLVQ